MYRSYPNNASNVVFGANYILETVKVSLCVSHLFPLVLIHALVNRALDELREQSPLRVCKDEGGELLARHELAVLFLHHDVEQAVDDFLQLVLLHVEQHLALLEKDVDVASSSNLRGRNISILKLWRIFFRGEEACLIGEVLLLDELHLRPEERGVVEGVIDVLVVERVLAVRQRDGEPPAAARPARHPAFQDSH